MSDAVSREAVLKAVYDWEEDWNSIYSAVLHLPAMIAKHDFAQLEALTAERDRLRAKLADAAVALDAAGMELSDFANCLSREPWAACLAYEAAIDARAALKGETP